MIRKIIQIDEEKCNGCGLCVPSCAEGAIAIVNGKAKLISDKYCDGLGACLKECPEGALKIVEREADPFDESAVHEHLSKQKDELPCGCPGASVRNLEPCPVPDSLIDNDIVFKSELSHWPVQLTLVPPTAPFLRDREVVLVADCVPFAYANFHRDFLKGRSVLVACPKLDDFKGHVEKLANIFKIANIKKLIIVHMEVPCCFGLNHMVHQAMEIAGKRVDIDEVTISVKGNIL